MELNFTMALCKVYSMAASWREFCERNHLESDFMNEMEIQMSNMPPPPPAARILILSTGIWRCSSVRQCLPQSLSNLRAEASAEPENVLRNSPFVLFNWANFPLNISRLLGSKLFSLSEESEVLESKSWIARLWKDFFSDTCKSDFAYWVNCYLTSCLNSLTSPHLASPHLVCVCRSCSHGYRPIWT